MKKSLLYLICCFICFSAFSQASDLKFRDGKFTIPKDTLLKTGRNTYPTGATQGADGFMNIPDEIDEELPF